jgi:lipoate synthase
MWSALQLSESQKATVKTIHAKYAPSLRVARKQASDSGASVFAQEMAEVRSILSVSQQETFDAYATGKTRPRRGSVAKVIPLKIAVPR